MAARRGKLHHKKCQPATAIESHVTIRLQVAPFRLLCNTLASSRRPIGPAATALKHFLSHDFLRHRNAYIEYRRISQASASIHPTPDDTRSSNTLADIERERTPRTNPHQYGAETGELEQIDNSSSITNSARTNPLPYEGFSRICHSPSLGKPSPSQRRLSLLLSKLAKLRKGKRPCLLALEPWSEDRETVVRTGYIANKYLRQKLRDGGNNMKSQIQILTTPTADTPGTALLLHFDQKRYLIGNITEGTQRACQQLGTRLLKTSEIFLTGRSRWQTMGGLFGMILTLADALSSAAASKEEMFQGKKKKPDAIAPTGLAIFGPPNLTHTFATSRRYIFRKGMPIYVNEFKANQEKRQEDGEIPPTWQDELVKVWAMPVAPPKKAEQPSGSSRPMSPRKRSYAEFADQYATPLDGTESEAEREDRYDQIRRGVLHDMFDSQWRLDALVEMRLAEVQLPATLFTRNEQTKQLELYKGPMPGGDEPAPDITVLVRKPWPGALVTTLPPTQPAPDSMSYIFRNHFQRGKFRPDRAKEFKIPPTMFKKLTAGENVEAPDGRIITPDMVLEPGRPGGGVAVVDLPSDEYVQPLIDRPEWQSSAVMEGVDAFVWILGAGVINNPALRSFMGSKKDMKHIISSPEHCHDRLSFDSAAASTVRLSQIDPQRFSIPLHQARTLSNTNGTTAADDKADTPFEVIPAQRGLALDLEPKREVKTTMVVPDLDTSKILAEVPEEVIRLGKQARADVEADRAALEAWAKNIPSSDAEIITLGTGSALPSKYRNVSATLVRVPGCGSYLFDAGECTLGQLKRVLPHDELKAMFKELRMIWISHLHADHHLGTTSVIKAWYEAVHDGVPAAESAPVTGADSTSTLPPNDRLAVISDTGMIDWLTEYSEVEDFGYSRILPLAIQDTHPNAPGQSTLFLPPSAPTRSSNGSSFPSLSKSLYPTLLGLSDIQAVQVRHCKGALAVSLTFPNGFKVSYSGDCRPSSAFAKIGRGSTVLIHEATFDDELKGDAVAKKHSTTSEALGVGASMGAKAVVLTHFSQRYQKIPVLETTQDGEDEPIEDAATEAVSADATMTEADPTLEVDAENGPEDEGQIEPDMDMTAPPPTSDESVKYNDAPGKGELKEARVKVKSKDMKVAVAFDYMRVKVGEIAQLEKFTPALMELFKVESSGEEGGDAADGVGVNANGGEKSGEGKKKKSKRFN